MREAYSPEALFARYEHQVVATYPNRLHPKDCSLREPSWKNLRRGLGLIGRIIWHVGVRGEYRAAFWRFAWRRVRRGQIDDLIGAILVGHHLIMFARAATSGQRSASNYSFRPQQESLIPAE
jgi:hypothetical protein